MGLRQIVLTICLLRHPTKKNFDFVMGKIVLQVVVMNRGTRIQMDPYKCQVFPLAGKYSTGSQFSVKQKSGTSMRLI